MATSRARLDTPQAKRLMTRLGRHWSHKFEVEMDEERLLVPFSEEARVTLLASDAVLDIEIEHPEAEGETLQTVVAEHLQRFSKDEALRFDWH